MSSPSLSVTSAIPTTLRPGQWEERVKKYENHWVLPHKVPGKVLIGTESVLARILHEATPSRLFTPISIGEMLEVRAWASSGLINNMAHKKHDEKILSWRRAGDTAELVPFGVDPLGLHGQVMEMTPQVKNLSRLSLSLYGSDQHSSQP